MITFLSFNALGQQAYNCITEDVNATNNSAQLNFTHSTDPAYLATFEPVVFKIHFWALLDDHDESNIDSYNFIGPSQYDVLDAVANLNKALNPFNIFFKYDGYSVINNSFMALQINPSPTDPTHPNYREECLQADYLNHTPYYNVRSYIIQNNDDPNIYKPDIINMYIMKEAVCFGGVGYVDTPFVSGNGLGGFNMVHEMGHALGLGHTRGPNGNYIEDPENPNEPDLCEHVTRDPNNSEYNATEEGDEVIDTAAVPDMYPLDDDYSYDFNSCEYIGPNGDCQGSEYLITPNDMKNVMGDAYFCDFDEIIFTTGQAIRMREQIEMSSLLASLSSSDVSPLYEPYQGAYFFVGPILPIHKVLFQPGFDYRFIPCSGDFPQPSGYYDLVFPNQQETVLTISKDEADFSIITHPNHTAIYIEQLPTGGHNCYNNYNRAASSGFLTKFNDGVINANVTITPQDSLSINNPNFINDLNSGLYKIDKEFDDGGATQDIIIKEGGN